MNNCMRLSWYPNSATIGMCADPVLLRIRYGSYFEAFTNSSTCEVKCVRDRLPDRGQPGEGNKYGIQRAGIETSFIQSY